MYESVRLTVEVGEVVAMFESERFILAFKCTFAIELIYKFGFCICLLLTTYYSRRRGVTRLSILRPDARAVMLLQLLKEL